MNDLTDIGAVPLAELPALPVGELVRALGRVLPVLSQLPGRFQSSV
jgi:FXSXX-COOH protein